MKATLLLFFAVSAVVLPAQEFDLTDPRTHWSVGVSAFEAVNLSPENSYLTRSFPLLLRERLEAIPEHYFSVNEIQAYREEIVHQERQRLIRAVRADRRARDDLFFDSGSPGDEAGEYDQRIDDYLAAIGRLEQLDREGIEFPRSKPLRFVSGAEGELVFDRDILSPYQLARQQELDALLWGRFEEVQGFLYFEVTMIHAVLGETMFTYSDAGTAVELYDLFDELIAGLATVLWGRDWSSLTVQTVPPGASVWLDDQFRGRTPLSLPYLEPGGRELRLQVSGYRPVLRMIDLFPYAEEVQTVTLTPQPREEFVLDSNPSGAAVYRGSEWLGTTPLGVEKPEELSRLLLRRGGYLDFPLYTPPAVEESVSAELKPESFDPGELQRRRRDELYRAFGAFALSVPFPLFLGGYRADYLAVGEDSSYLYYGYIGTFALSSGLFVNLLVRLVRYLQAADRKA
jgi:hypothetical protein